MGGMPAWCTTEEAWGKGEDWRVCTSIGVIIPVRVDDDRANGTGGRFRVLEVAIGRDDDGGASGGDGHWWRLLPGSEEEGELMVADECRCASSWECGERALPS